MRAQEKRIAAEFGREAIHERLMSLPGVGPTLGAVLAAEIDQIGRFPNADKLCAYAGVVPTTHSSGGKTTTAGCCPRATNGCAGPGRSELGGHRLLALLRRHLPAPSPAWQESQHRHPHRRPAYVPHHLASFEQKRDFEKRPARRKLTLSPAAPVTD